MRRLAVGFAVACLVACLLTATAQQASAPVPVAAVRVAYLVQEGTPVLVRVNDVTVAASAAPGSVSGYRSVASGDREIGILDVSDDAPAVLGPASVPARVRARQTFEPGRYYTVVVTEAPQSVGEGAEDGNGSVEGLTVQVFHDPYTEFAGAGDAWLRLVNLVAHREAWSARTEPNVDGAADDEQTAGAAVTVADALGYGRAGPWVAVPAGVHRIVFEGGSENGPVRDAVEIALHGGTLYTAYVYRTARAGPAAVTLHIDGVVRAAPGSVSAPPGDTP